MPATSSSQKRLACMALAMRKGELSEKNFPNMMKKNKGKMPMADMSEEELTTMCKSPVKE